MLTTILSLLGSSILSPLANAVVSVMQSKANVQITQIDANKDVDIATLQAAAAAYHEQMALNQVRWGWAPYRWLVLAIAFPVVWHAGGVFLDSCSYLPWIDWSTWGLIAHKVGSWRFAEAPGQFADFEFSTLAGLAGVILGQGGIAAWLHKK